RASCDDLLLVANAAEAAEWLPGVRMVGDVIVDQGSLGGIHAALVHAATPVLVVAWDMPFVPVSLARQLRAAGEGADAVLPESGSRRGVEPLCAWYGPACIPAIEQRLAEGDRRVIGFLDLVRVVRMAAEEVAQHGDPEHIFSNVNTPEELQLAERHATTADDRRPQA
ncbi:MAG: molybdenum cofactor guanylyltransferase, partial [Gemmatimonadetes bacterium]|nr:molybdenum cofactor guanylyltransferase [Gemmatimonadota bacterium]